MRQKMVPGPFRAKGAKKPKTEFEAFDQIATTVFNTPKPPLKAKKKAVPKRRRK